MAFEQRTAEHEYLTGTKPVQVQIGLPLAPLLNRFGKPVLQILDLYMPHAPDAAGRDQPARLANHRIAGVGLGQDERQAGFGHQPHQRFGIFDGGGRRLGADHGNPGAQEGSGDRGVRVVGRSDGYSIDSPYDKR